MNNKKNTSKSIVTLLIGLMIGAILGMLFSPTGGSKMRGFVRYQCRNMLQKVKHLFIQLMLFKKHLQIENEGKIASQEVIEKTVKQAKKILEEVERLSHQLDDHKANV